MSRKTALILAMMLFLAGAALRLTDFSDLPLDFHPTRQLFSALKARGMCYQARDDVPEWQQALALQQWRAQAAIEPPLVEHLAAFICRQSGVEVWLAGRAWSILFWLLGGLGIWRASAHWAGAEGRLLALAVYLFLPYGVYASRSFQPDPLMVALWTLFLAAALDWRENPDWKHTFAAAALGGLAIFVKSVAVFMVGGVLMAVALSRFGWRDFWRQKRVWGLAVLTALPTALYTLYGLLIAGYLGSQFGGRFFPSMLVSPFFYLRWELKLAEVLGQLGIALALLGWALTPRRGADVLTGAWLGYLLFGLVFNYHFSTHDYYHLPLIPVASLSLAVLGDLLARALRQRWQPSRWLATALFSALLFFGVAGAAWTARSALRSVDYRPQAALYAQIGALLGHEAHAVALTPDYGYRLAYWGWLDAAYWPTLGDLGYSAKRGADVDTAALCQSKMTGKDFFIITDFDEWTQQPFLQDCLAGFPVWARGEEYLIYDLRAHE